MRFRIGIVILSAILFSCSAHAATYYVSLSGNDANPGTLSAPFRTIGKAAGLAVAGDVINVRAGVYSGKVSISSKGTSAARITFRSYPGELAVIDGTGMAAGTDLVVLYQTAFVDFSGFEVRNSKHIGICVWGSNNTRVLSNNVHDSVRNGIFAGADAMGPSHDIVIDGNHIHDNVLENEFSTMTTGGWATGVAINNTDHAQVSNNRVDHNHGEGIGSAVANNVGILNNEVSDNFSVNIYLDNTRYATVDRNYIYTTGDSRFLRDGYPAAGIGTANEFVSVANPLSDIVITNNVVVGGKWGFYYLNYEMGGGLKNTTIANNTFYKAGVAVIQIASDSHANTVVENNIFDQAGGGLLASVAGAGITYRNNDWYGGVAGAAAGAGDFLGDPKLVNAGGLTAADYKLTLNSPLLLKGASISAVSTDFFGTPRETSNDIGAHQYSIALSSGPVYTQPQAPTALSASLISGGVGLAWVKSADASVSAYKIYRNGAYLATVGAASWSDSTVQSSTTYTYEVSALDSASNESALSNGATITTASGSKHRAARS